MKHKSKLTEKVMGGAGMYMDFGPRKGDVGVFLGDPPKNMNPRTNKKDGLNNPLCPGCGGRDISRLGQEAGNKVNFRCNDEGCGEEFSYET